jgi:2-iminobutanoate/2-iminopropanoate deaminase
MEIESLEGPGMPQRLGPYSQAVRAGDLLFVSGQPGIDPTSGEVPPGGFEAEAAMAFQNLRQVVEAAGTSLDRVVKTTVYLASGDDFPVMNRLYGEAFPQSPPTRAAPIVDLPRGLRISIEAVAAY